MKDFEQKVEFKDENGNSFDMIILKEFSHKDKKYAVLMEDKSCEHHDCDGCEKNLVLLEITNDKDGKEVFAKIKDQKLFDEIVAVAEEEMYKD